MATETGITEHEDRESRVVVHRGGGSDSVYGLGMIGAWIYYLRRATDTRTRVQGILKGLVWPAILVYELLSFVNGLKPETASPAPAPEPSPATPAKTPTPSRRGAKPPTAS